MYKRHCVGTLIFNYLEIIFDMPWFCEIWAAAYYSVWVLVTCRANPDSFVHNQFSALSGFLTTLFLATWQVNCPQIPSHYTWSSALRRVLGNRAACSATSVDNFLLKDTWEHRVCRVGYGFLEKWLDQQPEELGSAMVVPRQRLKHLLWHFFT